LTGLQPLIQPSLLNAVRLERELVSDFNARIFHFTEARIAEVKYTETEHYQITKDFLNRHERMLEMLLTAENEELKSKERK